MFAHAIEIGWGVKSRDELWQNVSDQIDSKFEIVGGVGRWDGSGRSRPGIYHLYNIALMLSKPKLSITLEGDRINDVGYLYSRHYLSAGTSNRAIR